MEDLTATQSILKLKCPRCRQGDLFTKPGYFVYKNMSTMPEYCPHCHLKYDQEPGFFWGAMYISYALAVAISLPVIVVLFALVGLTLTQSIAIGSLVLLVLVPVVFRLSRSIWIHMFVRYRPQHQ